MQQLLGQHYKRIHKVKLRRSEDNAYRLPLPLLTKFSAKLIKCVHVLSQMRHLAGMLESVLTNCPFDILTQPAL